MIRIWRDKTVEIRTCGGITSRTIQHELIGLLKKIVNTPEKSFIGGNITIQFGGKE